MSYKSLLFCPDEKTARVVTQVLSELEFTVELSGEPFATVKKLTDEHFDALVVDCQNEQDASLLFKAARNSSLNHSSLSVAVVEGQAGVAKAFRIGANLVLSKPVNVEQSKSTLRVARGLLRKNSEARAAAAAAPGTSPASVISKDAPVVSASAISTPAMLPAKTLAQEAPAFPAVSPAVLRPAIAPAPATPAPYAGLELEKEPTPAAEPSEVALLESMPNPIDGKPAASGTSLWAPRSQGQAEPIAANTGGAAAAVAPALEKPGELRLAGASPMVTQEPIISESGATEHFPVDSVPVPTFSSDLGATPSSSGGVGKFIKNLVVVLILFVAGYMAWQRLQPLQYLPGSTAAQAVKATAASPEPSPVAAPAAASSPDTEKDIQDAAPTSISPELTAAPASSATTSGTSASAGSTAETIRVQELPLNSDQKTSIPPQPRPIVVQAKPGSAAMQKPVQQQATPPALPPATMNNSTAALSSIVATNAVAPTPAPGSFRVSQGVSQGLVIKKAAPVYPATALQLHKEGAVELMASINKEGTVTGVRVLSGDLMLAKSAVEAVKQWKYRPYLLNGDPVEIETQITVNFKIPR